MGLGIGLGKLSVRVRFMVRISDSFGRVRDSIVSDRFRVRVSKSFGGASDSFVNLS